MIQWNKVKKHKTQPMMIHNICGAPFRAYAKVIDGKIIIKSNYTDRWKSVNCKKCLGLK